jgi:hypothetical protein
MDTNPHSFIVANVANFTLFLFVVIRFFVGGFSNFRLKLFAVVILAVVLYAGREVSAYYIKPETPMVWSLVSTIGMRVVAAFVYLKVIEYDD